MSLDRAVSRNTQEEESAFDIETRYMRDGREGASIDDVMRLISASSMLPAQAMAEGGYMHFTQEQNRDIARKVLERGIDSLMRPERGGYSIQQLMQVVTRAALTPEETVAQIQKLASAQMK